MKELVVATCKEDLSWIDDASKEYDNVTVYDKCRVNPKFKSANVSVTPIPNVGSCDNAFLTYIIDRYETLPDEVEFTKGSTHWSRHECIPCTPCEGESEDLLNFKLDNWSFTNNSTQSFEFVKSGCQNMREWIEKETFLDTNMFEESSCNVRLGGHFRATKEQIKNMPKHVYANLRNQQHHTNAEVDHFIERSWGTMFCTKKIV